MFLLNIIIKNKIFSFYVFFMLLILFYKSIGLRGVGNIVFLLKNGFRRRSLESIWGCGNNKDFLFVDDFVDM